MFIIKDIPSLAWLIVSLSGLILSSGFCVSIVRSTNSTISVEVADFKIESTARLNRFVTLSKELEEKANALQERDKAYDKLQVQYQNLLKYNQPLKMLEPAIKEVDRVNTKTNLAELEKAIEKTTEEATQQIEEIAELSKNEDAKKDKLSEEKIENETD